MNPKRPEARIARLLADFHWDGLPDEAYKTAGDHFRGVRRVNLAGMRGENTRFHVRYFEIEPGGFTSREHHRHEHVVVVLRGSGELLLGETRHALRFGDTAYVPPDTSHQLHNMAAEPFGFLCIVDAQRDAPVVEDVPLGEQGPGSCSR